MSPSEIARFTPDAAVSSGYPAGSQLTPRPPLLLFPLLPPSSFLTLAVTRRILVGDIAANATPLPLLPVLRETPEI